MKAAFPKVADGFGGWFLDAGHEVGFPGGLGGLRRDGGPGFPVFVIGVTRGRTEVTFESQFKTQPDEFAGGVGGHGNPCLAFCGFFRNEEFHPVWLFGESKLISVQRFSLLIGLIIEEFFLLLRKQSFGNKGKQRQAGN